MYRKIALLRGINVGGHRKILMADLKSMFEELGFSDVQTYIQSGNVFFNTEDKISNVELTHIIEQKIQEVFGFEVPVIIRTHKEIQDIISQNPFYKSEDDIAHLHVIFLDKEPSKEKQESLQDFDSRGDKFQIQGTHIYIYCQGKYFQSKLTNHLFEKRLNVITSTRNWRTTLKLYELSK